MFPFLYPLAMGSKITPKTVSKLDVNIQLNTVLVEKCPTSRFQNVWIYVSLSVINSSLKLSEKACYFTAMYLKEGVA